MSPDTCAAKIGDTIHVLSAFAYCDNRSWLAGKTAHRGQSITVTEELVEANRGRSGRSWLDLVNDPAAQVRRFGREIVGPGPFPDALVPTVPGTLDHRDARLAAHRAARQMPLGAERDAALRKVEEMYGPAEPTSRTNAVYHR